jgi:pre-rRNA-processing protein IPI1
MRSVFTFNIGIAADRQDASVRKALIGFFGWYLITLPTVGDLFSSRFPLTPQSILTPHLPLLQLQTSSALSHIFPEIRLDAARLVHLFLEQIPTHITRRPTRRPSEIGHLENDPRFHQDRTT